MPRCFQLSRKTAERFIPEHLAVIDDEICAHFGVKPDPIKYHNGWFDSIGLMLACGVSWEKMIEEYEIELSRLDMGTEETEYKVHQLEIIQFMQENYVADCFWQGKF